ncbi:MAG: hypothetical protein GY833_21930 [Aestuariibacter sp.]|nr:hypothetical protein [Aestuariibacter sp.]|tara:strand:+ start:83287 stop:83484 length:198 start_codon:yes stop_codon:yes gene_type:complete
MDPMIKVSKRGEVKKSCPKGFKLFRGTCVKMSDIEMQRRREGARKAMQNRKPRKPRRPAGMPKQK